MASGQQVRSATPTKAEFEQLGAFRQTLRRYLRFSEETVRSAGLPPQQYQLLLALKGMPGREWALIRELAEALQLRHHTVVGLVDRAQAKSLVQRTAHAEDARAVRVVLTPTGEQLLGRLSGLHLEELRRLGDAMTIPREQPGQEP
ncbi:MAG: MarR family winged helix-turn-helix transcriptional regulator [Mycobacteriales bacterium]